MSPLRICRVRDTALVPAAVAALQDLVAVGREPLPVVCTADDAAAEGWIEHGDGLVSDTVGWPSYVRLLNAMLTPCRNWRSLDTCWICAVRSSNPVFVLLASCICSWNR